VSEPPLDLAILLFDLAPSGVANNAIRVAKAAHEAGIRTEIWLGQRQGALLANVPSEVRVRSFGQDIGPSYSRDERKKAISQAKDGLAVLLQDVRPKVLLSAGNHAHSAAVAAIAASGVQTRLIGRISNALPRFHWDPARLRGSIRKRLAARKRFGAMDRIICVSKELRHQLVSELLLNRGNMAVIPNGVDMEAVSRLAAEPVDHPWLTDAAVPVVIGVGRFVPQKNFEVLLRAFAAARKAGPIRLILLGSGPEKERLKRLARRLKITRQVDFPGHVPNPFPYLRKASLFVLPSRWEGMSNALLEALATGCPAVATHCPGSTELLDHGTWGLLVPVDDVAALTDAILATLANPPSREHQIARAAQYELGSAMCRYVEIIGEEMAKAGR
jgi:glycosyltransferase involved in cell wall biosynthesis